jgi:hypothetical protein
LPSSADAWQALADDIAASAGIEASLVAEDRVPTASSALGRRRILHALGYLGPGPADEAAAERDLLADFRQLTAMKAEVPLDVDQAFDRLAQALRLEGDPLVRSVPARGAEGLAVRILQAQLVLLGASAAPVGRPFSQDDDFALISVSRWLRVPGDPRSIREQLQLDGGRRSEVLQPVLAQLDLRVLTQALIARDPTGFLVAPASGMGPAEDGPIRTLPDGTFPERQNLLERLFVGQQEVDPPLLETAFDGDPRRMAEDNGNRMGLRLIQLRMQQSGFYDTTIDGLFGRRSWSALAAAAQREDVAGGPIEVFAACFRVLPGEAYAAVSLKFLDATVLRDAAPMSEADLRKLLGEDEANALVVDQDRLLKAEEHARLVAPPPQDPSPVVGVFRSVGRVIAGAVDAIRGFFRSVGSLVERMFEPIADLLAWLRRKARQIVEMLARLVAPLRRLVFCEPWGDDKVLSRIAPDRDTVLFVDRGASSDVVAGHLAELARHSFILRTTGRILGLIVRVAVSAVGGPAGWVAIVVLVVREAPELLGIVTESRASEAPG